MRSAATGPEVAHPRLSRGRIVLRLPGGARQCLTGLPQHDRVAQVDHVARLHGEVAGDAGSLVNRKAIV